MGDLTTAAAPSSKLATKPTIVVGVEIHFPVQFLPVWTLWTLPTVVIVLNKKVT